MRVVYVPQADDLIEKNEELRQRMLEEVDDLAFKSPQSVP